MNKLLTVLIFLTLSVNASAEETFEVNKANCNLPIDEIIKRFPKANKEQIKQECTKKASSNNWMKKSLVDE